MNVYIDCRRIERDKKKRDWILPFHERGVIAFTDRGSDEPALDSATVYENQLLRTRLPAQARLPNEPADLNFPRSVTVKLNQALQ